MDVLRIFISSPGDVAEERERARQVVQGLRRRYARHFELVPVFWEDMPLGLDTSFQEGIDVLLSKDQGVDIAVFILWSRLGSKLGPKQRRQDGSEYRSGTERELDLMLQARAAQQGKRPQILAYARQDDATFEESLRGTSTAEKEARINQKKLVESFIQEEFHDTATGTNLRAYHTYSRPQTFGERLRVHLQEILDGMTAGRTSRPAWDIDERGAPFLGLESFRFEHAEVFFGREDEVSEARLRLAQAAKRGTAFLLVSGSSGTGKSSLAAAGILPEIVAHETDDQVARWLHASFTPSVLGGDPAAGMARILAGVVPGLATRSDTADFAEGLRRDPVVAIKLALLPALKAEAGTGGAVRLVLLVDQLEELFTDARLTAEFRDQFARILEALATSGNVWIVATIRGDFYPRLLTCEGLVRLTTGGAQLPLVPPGADALRRVIESPALLSGLTYEQTGETSLADRILRDVSGQAELLPLLEDLLRELFEKRSADGVLTVKAYESLGGIEGALAKRAEASLAALPSAVQLAFPDVLRRLVTSGEGADASGVRRRVALDSLAAGSPARALVDRLVADRLATASAGDDGNPEVSIAHEAILRVWPRAASWIRENQEFLKVRDRLAARMREQAPLSAADPLVPAARAILGSRHDAFEPDLASYIGEQLAAIDAEKRARERRRRLSMVAAGVALVAATIGGVVLRARFVEQKRSSQAEGAVAALLQAGSGQIGAAVQAATLPEIVDKSRAMLVRGFAEAKDAPAKLRAAVGLAGVPGAPDEVWSHLAQSLLKADPREVRAIRAALEPQAGRFKEMLWETVASPGTGPERLRAAAALATYDPQGAGWKAAAPALAGDLVNVPAVYVAEWLDSLREVRGKLVPSLVPIVSDLKRSEIERSLATDILADYAADDPVTLAELAMTVEPKQFAALAGRVAEQAAGVVPILEAEIAKRLPEEMPLAAPEREVLGIRQAKAAAVLARLGKRERVWPLFIHSPDPRVRSYLIHFLGPFGADPGTVAERLKVEPDVSAKRALVLALGEMAGKDAFGGGAVGKLRAALVPVLRGIFETDPDPGLHSAAEWTLKQCGDGEWVAARVAQWRDEAVAALPVRMTPEAVRLSALLAPPTSPWRKPTAPAAVDPPQLAAIRKELSDDGPKARRWYVNGQGQTLVVIPGPVEFLMGSTPESDADRSGDEQQHVRRIGRTFAIGVTHVTLGEYERIVPEGRIREALSRMDPRWTRTDDLPVTGMGWFEAAWYCNALSRAEGLPRSEWVYEETGGSIKLAEGWLGKSGYRLPTEAEWEFASRAGALTSRFYGQSETLLGDYAWYLVNSSLEGKIVPWPVGEKKPNDTGLFDGLGNVWNWCQEEYDGYPEGTSDDDAEGSLTISRENSRVLRGGSFVNLASLGRSANRLNAVPTGRSYTYGLRVARTLPPVSLTALPERGGSGEKESDGRETR